MKWCIALVATVTVAGVGAVAAATPADVITARQKSFKTIARANKAIQDELRKDAPDVAIIRAAAKDLGRLSPGVAHWFPQGTGAQSGTKTGALPAIWSDRAGFARASNRFVSATRALQGAADRKDLARIRPAAAALGGSCKGCHDSYRLKD